MFSLNSFCLSFCFPLFLKTQFPFFSSLIYNIWVTIFALIHNSFMTKSCQQETRIKGLAFLNLVNSEYFLFLSPKKTQAFTLFIFQGHQNISSGILDSYEYHILSKNDDYFFSKNHFGLFVYCIFWPSSKSPLCSIFTKRTTYYRVTICTSKFKCNSGLSTTAHLNTTQRFGFQGGISWKFLLHLYKEAGSNLCTLGLRKAKISVTSWDRNFPENLENTHCLTNRPHNNGVHKETAIKPHP